MGAPGEPGDPGRDGDDGRDGDMGPDVSSSSSSFSASSVVERGVLLRRQVEFVIANSGTASRLTLWIGTSTNSRIERTLDMDYGVHYRVLSPLAPIP